MLFIHIYVFIRPNFVGTPMTQEAASRIQSAEARQGGGGAEKGGFASRAQAAAAKNVEK